MTFNWDNFGNSWSFWSLDWELENALYDGMGKKTELGGYGEDSADDVLDRLPVDPFGMDIKSTFTAITGWFQDFEEELGSDFCGFEMDETEKMIGDHKFFAGLNWVWNGSTRFQQEKGNTKPNEISVPYGSFNGSGIDNKLCDDGLYSNSNVEEFFSFSHVGSGVLDDKAEGLQDCSRVYVDDCEGDAPHDALYFALGYLGVKDLLVVERVCRSFRNAIRSDPLLWRSIHIDQPLSERITDDALAKLTSRAQGTLQCLSLVECIRITDSGLKHVLESNPRLIKLCVPGCVRLSIEGILFNLRAFKSAGTLGIKHLRIGGLFGVTDMQFEELKFLLGADNFMQLRAHKPQFYSGRQLYISCDDERAIDIESCPRCQKLTLVYDCPAERCQGKHQAAQLCRACTLCIARCIHCGRCINDSDYEETFCLDLLCLDCLKLLLRSQERSEVKGTSSSELTIFPQDRTYQFCLYG